MYNVEKYIKICVDSILAQTFQDFEIIIVDDCSTDNSYELCRELYGDNEKIRIFQQEKNQGQGPARNFGLKNARGEYVWFIDGDDAILPDIIKKLHKVTKKTENGVDVIHFLGHYRSHQEDSNPIRFDKLEIAWENRQEGFLGSDIRERLINNWIKNRIWANTFKFVYKRNFLIDNGIHYPDAPMAQDQPFALEALCLAKNYFMLKDNSYIYRHHSESVVHSPRIDKFGKVIKSIKAIFNYEAQMAKKIPILDENRILREQCLIQTFEAIFRDHIRPLYDGENIPIELDNAIYEEMLPIFGENTTLVKYLFHGFNNTWWQANIFAQQNYLLRQREDLIQQQNKLIKQLKRLLDDYDKKII
ncbi:MAG: glycosyltransferase family 2 protein [Selenomonadaceae bacterium]|nr:glycosyltransferase family 2 protein [Selenomonadaceae bacterium]